MYRRVIVYYREYARTNLTKDTKSLAELIRDALESGSPPLKTSWNLRSSPPTPREGIRRVINPASLGECIFGNMVSFNDDQYQAVLDTQGSKENIVIIEIPVQVGRPPLHGLLHWLVYRDHVYVIHDSRVRTKAFEEYLNWLLVVHTKLLNKEFHLKTKVNINKISDIGVINEIQLGGIIPINADTDDGLYGVDNQNISNNPLFFQRGREIFDNLLGDASVPSIQTGAPPRMNVVLKTGSRDIESSLDFVARELINDEDGALKIVGTNGVIKGNDAMLSTETSIRRIEQDSLSLDLSEMYTAILGIHADFVNKGLIVEN